MPIFNVHVLVILLVVLFALLGLDVGVPAFLDHAVLDVELVGLEVVVVEKGLRLEVKAVVRAHALTLPIVN